MNTLQNILSKDDLIAIFQDPGIRSGMTLIVHSALSSFGYILGGAETFNDALLETIGYHGTLIMPLQAADRGEPSYFEHPAVPLEKMDKFRQELPAYDPRHTETYHMSRAVDNLRRRERSYVSRHPVNGFVAVGRMARILTADSSLSFSLGEDSLLGRLYELRAYCFLAGVSYENMTALHLAEYRAEARPVILQGSAVSQPQPHWQKFLDLDIDSQDGCFAAIGRRLEERGQVRKCPLYKGEGKLIRIDTAVDTGVEFFRERSPLYPQKKNTF